MKSMLVFALCGLLSTLQAKDLARAGSQAVSEVDWKFAVDAATAKAGRALGPEERKELLQSMLRQRLLVAEAKSRRYDKEAAHKASMAELERQRLAERLYSEEVLAKAEVEDAQAQEILKAEPRAFDRVLLGQILLVPKKGQEAAIEAEALSLAKALRKDPKRFAAKAKSRSEDPLSGPRGGDLGELGPHQLLPELAQAAFAAKAPAIVGPIATRHGWHILQVRKINRSTWPKDAARVKGQIQAVRAQKLESELMERLAKEHKVTVKEENP